MRILRSLLLALIVITLFIWAALPPFFNLLPGNFRTKIEEISASTIEFSEGLLPGSVHAAVEGWVSSLGKREPGKPATDPGRGTAYAGYDREDYGGWIDEDRNCMDTRAEVLSAMSTGPVRMRSNGCSVDSGKWFDPYTNRTFTLASELDIDHIVPLAWAHAHGAAAWPSSKKTEFANWQPNLIPVEAAANRQKGASAPWDWMPPNDAHKCQYLIRFQRIALQWELEFSRDEKISMNGLAKEWC